MTIIFETQREKELYTMMQIIPPDVNYLHIYNCEYAEDKHKFLERITTSVIEHYDIKRRGD